MTDNAIDTLGRARQMQPTVIDNDKDEITVELNGREIRGWSYKDDAERRTKMLMAQEFADSRQGGAHELPEM